MQVLSESLEALPMMAERTMIQVDDVDLFALPEDDRTQLAALFSDIPDYACAAWKDSSGEDSPPRRRAHRSCRASSAPGRPSGAHSRRIPLFLP